MTITPFEQILFALLIGLGVTCALLCIVAALSQPGGAYTQRKRERIRVREALEDKINHEDLKRPWRERHPNGRLCDNPLCGACRR